MTAFEQPMNHADGTRTALVAEFVRPLSGYSVLSLRLPPGSTGEPQAGRYFLARCGAQSATARREHWQFYLRRPLFVTGFAAGVQQNRTNPPQTVPAQSQYDRWDVMLPGIYATPGEIGDARETPPEQAEGTVDPGYAWLARRAPGAPVNVIGPLGRGFRLAPDSRNLVLAATATHVGMLLPLIDPMLDRGGRVTLVVRRDPADGGSRDERALMQMMLAQLPIAVELRVGVTPAEWDQHLHDVLPWADQLCAALPAHEWGALAQQVRQKRFHLEAGFAQVLVEADLVCGVGACLACVVPLARGGVTRACVNGPVFDLTKLTA